MTLCGALISYRRRTATGVFELRRVRGGEAAAYGRGLVADDIREQERDYLSRGRPPHESPPFKVETCLRTVLISPIVRPAPQERTGELLEVFEGDAGSRVRQKRRSPAGDEDQQEVTILQPIQKLLNPFGRPDAPLVGLRVGCGDGLERLGRLLAPRLDHAQTAAQSLSEDLSGGPGHRPRGLANRQHKDALRLERFLPNLYAPVLHAQEPAHCPTGLRCRQRRVQDLP